MKWEWKIRERKMGEKMTGKKRKKERGNWEKEKDEKWEAEKQKEIEWWKWERENNQREGMKKGTETDLRADELTL